MIFNLILYLLIDIQISILNSQTNQILSINQKQTINIFTQAHQDENIVMRRKSDIDPSIHMNIRKHDLQNYQIRGSDRVIRYQSPQNLNNMSKSKSRSKIKMIVNNMPNVSQKERDHNNKNNKRAHDQTKFDSQKAPISRYDAKLKSQKQKPAVYIPKGVYQCYGDPFESNPSSTNHTMIIKPSSSISSHSGIYYSSNPNKQTAIKQNPKNKKNVSGLNVSTKATKKVKTASKSKDQKKIMLVLNDSAAKIQRAWRAYSQWKLKNMIRRKIQKARRQNQLKNPQNIRLESFSRGWEQHLQMNKCARPEKSRKISLKQSSIDHSQGQIANEQSLFSAESSSNDTFMKDLKGTRRERDKFKEVKEVQQLSKDKWKQFQKLKKQYQQEQTPGKTPCGKDLQPHYNLNKYQNCFNGLQQANKQVKKKSQANASHKQQKAARKKNNQISEDSSSIDANFDYIRIHNPPKLLERQFYQDRGQPNHLKQKRHLCKHQQVSVESSSQSQKDKTKPNLTLKNNLFSFSFASSPSKKLPSPKAPQNSLSKNRNPYEQTYHQYHTIEKQSPCQSPHIFSLNSRLKTSIDNLLDQCKKVLNQGKISKLLSIQDKFRDQQISQRFYESGTSQVSSEYQEKLRLLQGKQKEMMGNWHSVLQLCQQIKKFKQSTSVIDVKQEKTKQDLKKKKFRQDQQRVVKFSSFQDPKKTNQAKKKKSKRQVFDQKQKILSPLSQFTKQLQRQNLDGTKKHSNQTRILNASLTCLQREKINQIEQPVPFQHIKKTDGSEKRKDQDNQNKKQDEKKLGQLVDFFILPQLAAQFCRDLANSRIQSRNLVKKLNRKSEIFMISPIQGQDNNQIKIQNQEQLFTSTNYEQFPSIGANDLGNINSWLLDISHFILDHFSQQLRANLMLVKLKRPQGKKLMSLIRSKAGDLYQRNYQTISEDIFITFQEEYKLTQFRIFDIKQSQQGKFQHLQGPFHLALLNALNQALLQELITGKHWISLPHTIKPYFHPQKKADQLNGIKQALQRSINKVSNTCEYEVSPLKRFQQYNLANTSQDDWQIIQQNKKALVDHEQVRELQLQNNFYANNLLLQISDKLIWSKILEQAIIQISNVINI